MKKKIWKPVCYSLSVIITAVLLAAGGMFLYMKINVARTGNVLGIEWYDPSEKSFTISTADELYELARLSTYYDFKGQTVNLGDDIIINEGNAEDWAESAPDRKWSPIKGFAGTFDGQNYTISGLYGKAYNTALALFSNADAGAKIQNLTLSNSYLEGRGFGGTASIVSGGGAKLSKIHSDAIIRISGAYGAYAGGICSKVTSDTVLDECWYDGNITTGGRVAGGLIDEISRAKVKITHSLFSGEINGTWDYSGSRIGGLVGCVDKSGASLYMEDTLAAGKVNAATTTNSGSIVGAVLENTVLECKNVYAGKENYSAIGSDGSKGMLKTLPLEITSDKLMGTTAYQWTALNFDKYWAVREKDTPVLQCFADTVPSLDGIQKAYDTTWYKKGKGGSIMTPEQLYGFYILSGGTSFETELITLGADITMNSGTVKDWKAEAPENVWFPLNGFEGTFDGQGHTISGIYINSASRYVGLFGMTYRLCEIKNFQLKNSLIINHSGGSVEISTGSIAGVGNGRFEGIYSNAVIDAKGQWVGGLIGQSYQKSTITDCWYDGELTLEGRYAGGILGIISGDTVNVEHCLNTGTINNTWEGGYVNSGGIVGATFYSSSAQLTISDCLNLGTIDTNQGGTGSILGHCIIGVADIRDSYALRGSNVRDNKMVGCRQGQLKGSGVTLGIRSLTGFNAFDWTTLDFDEHWSIVKDGTPMLTRFAASSPSVAGRTKAFDLSWYDETAEVSVIQNAKQLYGFYMISGGDLRGKTFKLGKDITLNSGDASAWTKTNIPAREWFPIIDFSGTFDGQGHSISGVYIYSDTRYNGFFGTTTTDAIVKNLKLKNSKIISETKDKDDDIVSTGSIAGVGHGTFDTIYSDAIIESAGVGVGGLIGQIYHPTTVRNCQYDGTLKHSYRYSGGIVGYVTGETAVIEHCLNSGSLIFDSNYDGYLNSGGILGAPYYGKGIEVTIKDCLNSGKITVVNKQGGIGSVVGHCVVGTVTLKDCYATAESSDKSVGYVNEKEGGVLKGFALHIPEAMMLGTDGYRTTGLDFSKYWSAIAVKTPQLKSFAGKGLSVAGLTKLYDTSWYNPSATEYTLSDAADLYGLSMLSITDNFQGKIIKLGKDIAINSGDASAWSKTNAPANEWLPINNFAGTFDGQGHTVSGIYIYSDTRYNGFFGLTTEDAVVKNLKLKNSKIISEIKDKDDDIVSTGSIAGVGHGTFDKIYSDAIVESAGVGVGGLIGQIYHPTTVRNCQYDGTLKHSYRYSGGIVGYVTGETAVIEHCLNSGSLIFDSNYDGYLNSGGILGASYYGKGIKVTIKDCLNSGKITVVNKQGGIGSVVGHCVVGTITLKDCYATAESSGKGIGCVNEKEGGVLKGTALQISESMMLGTDGYRTTELDFSKYWSAIAAKTPQLKSFAGQGLNVAGLTKLYDTSWYDSSATEYMLSDAQDLFGLSMLSIGNDFAGKTIKLENDIEFTSEWIPITQFAGTFDGQGHQIAGLDVPAGAGFFTSVNDAVIKNFRISGSVTNAGDGGTGSVAGSGSGVFSCIYSNVKVVVDNERIGGGIIGTVVGDTTMEQVQFDGEVTSLNQTGGMVAAVNKSNVTMKDCLMSGKVTVTATSGHLNAGLFAGRIYGQSDLVIVNSLSTGYLKATPENFDTMYCRALVGKVEGEGTYFHCQNVSYINDAEHIMKKDLGYCALISGGNWKPGMAGKNITRLANIGVITGADAMYNLTGIEFCVNAEDISKPWVAIDEKTPALRIFATGTIIDLAKYVLADTTWYTSGQYQGTSGDPYIIRTAGELLGLSNLVTGTEAVSFENKYVKLDADIVYNHDAPSDLADWADYDVKNTFQPIGDGNHPFKGTFDGNGHSISGIYVNHTAGNFTGLFGATGTNAVVKNLTMKNSYIIGAGQTAGIVGRGRGTFQNITCSAVVVGGEAVGGIIGMVNEDQALVQDCKFIGELKGTRNVGGMIGIAQSYGGTSPKAEVRNCRVDAAITQAAASGNANAGGMVGCYTSTHADGLRLTDCRANIQLSGNRQFVGGLVGHTNQKTVIEGCLVTGTVSGTVNAVGGMIGVVNKASANISLSKTTADVVAGTNTVGGMVGLVMTNGARFVATEVHIGGSVRSTETVSGKHMNVGGLVGRVESANGEVISVRNAFMSARLSGTSDQRVARFIGRVDSSCSVVLDTVYYVNDASYIPSGLSHANALNSSITIAWTTNKAYGRSEEQFKGANASGTMNMFQFCANASDETKNWAAIRDELPTLRIFAVKENILTISN